MNLFKKNTTYLIILLFLISHNIFSQSRERYTVSGYIYEEGSRETLIGVNIYEPDLRSGTTTNNYGFYSITVPSDSITLVYSYVGYERKEKTLILDENKRIDIMLKPSIELDEIVITDERERRISQTSQMSRLEVPVHQIQSIPSLLGERDVFKVLQLMPGVQSGTEGTSGFYVRGGAPDQNLIILDDATVYNANHLFGFFSIFNGDAIKNMQLYKGGFPARFGGRLSSVLDIQMKDGNKEKFKGEAGIGLISSRLTLEGPIVKDKASFLVSGRRTYLDILTKPFMPQDEQGGYFFYDLNAKMNYDIDPNNRIFVSGYFGRDKFFFKEDYSDEIQVDEMEGGLYWQNSTSTLRWNHIFNDKIFANTSFIYSDYTLSIYAEEYYKDKIEDESSTFKLEYNSGIRDIGVKYDLSWYPLPNNHIRTGLSVIQHRFTPSAVVLRDDDIGRFEQEAEILSSVESGLYIENEMSVGDRIKLNPGLRFSHFYTEGKSYQNIEPRLSSNFLILPDLSFKASFASMNQYVHLLSPTGIGLPTDLWVPTTDRIKPQETWQVAAGFAYDWLKPNIEISLEGYYKKSDNIIGYKEGASFMLIDDPTDSNGFSWQDNITHGEAWSYGAEFLIQRKSGQFSGWIGYTLSWTEHRFDELNFAEKYWARYDRRHDLSIVGIYEINSDITLSATWVYATGNAFDLGTGRYPVMRHYVDNYEGMMQYPQWLPQANIYDEKNSFRAESYQRLDIGVQFHKSRELFGNNIDRTIDISVYNTLNRKNPFFYYIQDRYDPGINDSQTARSTKLMRVSVFPIIPSISLSYSF